MERFRGTRYNQHQRVWGSVRQNHHTDEEEAAVRGVREESQGPEGNTQDTRQIFGVMCSVSSNHERAMIPLSLQMPDYKHVREVLCKSRLIHVWRPRSLHVDLFKFISTWSLFFLPNPDILIQSPGFNLFFLHFQAVRTLYTQSQAQTMNTFK